VEQAAAHGRSVTSSASSLSRDLSFFASALGERHDGTAEHHWRLTIAADEIAKRFSQAGLGVRRETFRGKDDRTVENIVGERAGTVAPNKIIVVGAHYDSSRGAPGADDNASGVAALLSLAGELPAEPRRTIRLVAFANEGRPHTRSSMMGSMVHASASRERGERILAMVSLDCIGFHVSTTRRLAWRDLTLVQRLLPVWTHGVFVVSDVQSRALAKDVAAILERTANLPIHRVTTPSFLPLAQSSDHGSFSQHGYPALMITDGAPLRYRHYRRETDTPDRLDMRALAALTDGVRHAIEHLAARSDPSDRVRTG
jgi:Zn-dependent M28 family amino/carboxypeptidase